MVNQISSWAGSVVTAVIIVTILEMILPEGKNKKYIKTVLGIYLLFTIISPIIKAVSGQELNVENILELEKFVNSNGNANSISIQTNSSIESIYETNLKKDIKEKLKQKGYEASQIVLTLELEDEHNYGKIKKATVSLTKSQEIEKKSESTNIIPVENVKIEIGKKTQEKSNERSITEKEKQEMKEYLSITYDVNKDNIIIY